MYLLTLNQSLQVGSDKRPRKSWSRPWCGVWLSMQQKRGGRQKKIGSYGNVGLEENGESEVDRQADQ